MKKAIFFDIDGTLIDTVGGKTTISERVKEKLSLLQELGHYIFIATGRPYSFIEPHLHEIGFDGYILTNGAQVLMGDERIYAQAMNHEFVKAFMKILDQQEIQYSLIGEKECYLDDKHSEFYDFYERLNILPDYFSTHCDISDFDVYKMEIFCSTEAILKLCHDFLENHQEYACFHTIDPTHLEVTLKDNHKATGIIKVLEYLDIPIEQSFAFGDGMNDLEMLSTVGCGIAMGNASDAVKQVANYVTDSVSHDGVVIGIEQYILNHM